MRLEYTENPPDFTQEDDKAILERVKARRGERGLLPLDLTLLHAPKVADGRFRLLFYIIDSNLSRLERPARSSQNKDITARQHP